MLTVLVPRISVKKSRMSSTGDANILADID